MKISIILISWNGLSLVKECLHSLKPFMQRPDVEIIFVDNGSEDSTVEYVKKNYPNIRLTELDRNFGVAYARNRGLEQAQGQYLFLLDNDTVVNLDAIEQMEQFMDNHKEAGMCGCKLIDLNGLVQESGKRYPGIKEKVANVLKGSQYRYAYSETVRSQVFTPEYLIGACQFIRAEAYQQTGLLDEHIFYGPEDADYCLRMSNLGWKLYYLPYCNIVHACQRRTNKRLFSRMSYLHVKALLYFYYKHMRFIS